jgi:hypothetical protein
MAPDSIKDCEWSGISDFQMYLFNEGTNFKAYDMLGAHFVEKIIDGKKKGTNLEKGPSLFTCRGD